MRFPAFRVIASLALFLLILSPAISSPALAQTPQLSTLNSQLSTPFNVPNLNPDVPRNQHTFAQAAMIEVLSSVFCLVTGIDPIDPAQGCLDIDPKTHKLGLRPPQNGQEPQINGLLGFLPGMFTIVYTPPVSSREYIRYLANNFGLVKPAYAESSNGFDALGPILPIWKASRNVTYLLFTLVFIIIGLGIMLRVKIDPRTVMTIQNQIPRIIIGVLLVAFSYAIAGLMIDGMWLITYAGINTITTSSLPATNPVDAGCSPELTLQQRATQNLLISPFSFGEKILRQYCIANAMPWPLMFSPGIGASLYSIGAISAAIASNGLMQITQNVSMSVGKIVTDLLSQIITGGSAPNCSAWNPLSWPACVLNYIVAILVGLIVLLALLWSLLRIWYDLLRAYIMIILYVISAPLWIIVGLLPGKPLGFGKWLRRMFVHLVVFPATIALLLTASILANIFKNAGSGAFVPPLIGQPNMESFGWILAFAVILMTPSLLNILKQNLHAMSQGGQIAGTAIATGVASGAAMPKGGGRAVWSRVAERNPYTGKINRDAPIYKWLAGNNPESTRSKIATIFLNADKAEQPKK